MVQPTLPQLALVEIYSPISLQVLEDIICNIHCTLCQCRYTLSCLIYHNSTRSCLHIFLYFVSPPLSPLLLLLMGLCQWVSFSVTSTQPLFTNCLLNNESAPSCEQLVHHHQSQIKRAIVEMMTLIILIIPDMTLTRA